MDADDRLEPMRQLALQLGCRCCDAKQRYYPDGRSTGMQQHGVFSSRRPACGGIADRGRLPRPRPEARYSIGCNEPDDTASEYQHAKDEDDALNNGDPGAELGQVVL